MKTVDIYTDGACSGNPGKGGYGVVLLYQGRRKELSDGFLNTTNNRMEIMAAIKGLECLKATCHINLYSDSKYMVDSVNKKWVFKWEKNNWMRSNKEKALNVDLWVKMLELIDKHDVTFIWVKGHANNIENERCDFLATSAINSNKLQIDENYI